MCAAPADTFVLSSKVVFSVRSFRRQLGADLPPGVGLDGAVRDFVALSIMMGNDYLPGSRFGAGPRTVSRGIHHSSRHSWGRAPGPVATFTLVVTAVVLSPTPLTLSHVAYLVPRRCSS